MAIQNDEDLKGKAIDVALLRRLYSFIKPYKTQALSATLLTLVASSLGPLRPRLMKDAIDNHIAKGDVNGLFSIGVLILGLIIAQGILNFGVQQLMQWVGQRTVFDVRMKIFRKIQSLSLQYHDQNPVGRLVTRVTSDVEVLNEVFSSGIVMIASDVLVIVWILFFMFYTSWQLALTTLISLPLLFIATNIFRKKVRDTFREVRKEVARLNSFLNEYVQGISIVQLFSQEKRQSEIFDEINTSHRDVQIKTIFYYAVFFPVVEMVSTIAITLMIWYAAQGLLDGTITIGVMIMFAQYAEMFFRPVRDLSEKYNTLQNAMASSERIFVLLDSTAEISEKQGAKSQFTFENTISFQNVNFGYKPDVPVLRNVSFEIPHGKTVAFVGATGAGKSSIVSLLCRFYEFQSGDISFDGVSIRDVTQQALRQKIAIVLQDVFLFTRSIADNISLGNPEITQEKIVASAMAVGAHEFISQLPNGYDTLVTERGGNLSVGQRQLLSFARALASDPDILILDEATSSVDTATEKIIEQAVEKLLQGRTAIVVAHRLSTIRKADKIVVLHRGEVREQGNHEELLEHNGLYAKLYRYQLKDKILV